MAERPEGPAPAEADPAGPADAAETGSRPSAERGRTGPGPWLPSGFLAPALLLLGLLVAYPILFTIWRSLYDAGGDAFVGLDNYAAMFTDSQTFTALKNNLIWVLVAPALITALGLMFAVL